MRKLILIIVSSSSLLAMPDKAKDWWLNTDKVIIDNAQVLMHGVKLSRCSIKKPFWYISSGSVKIKDNIAYLHNPLLNFGSLKLPVLFDNLPLSGAGRSGLLPLKLGHNLNLGNYLTLPFYIWYKKNHYLNVSISRSGLMGSLFSLAGKIGHYNFWIHKAAADRSWRFKAIQENKSYGIDLDWSDTNSKDLFWLWRIKSMNVIQGRLERFFKIRFNNLFFEYVAPKVLASSFDKLIPNDYSWVPRITLNNESNMFQFTRFNLNNKLQNDPRPKKVDRFVIEQDFKNTFKILKGALETDFTLHFIEDNYNNTQQTAIVPFGMIKWHKIYGKKIEPIIALRVSKYVNQTLFPVLDTENIQQNINSWLGSRIYAGHDRISDVNSLLAAMRLHGPNGELLFGVKHRSAEKVCLQPPCIIKAASNEFAFGVDAFSGISGLLITNANTIRSFDAKFSHKIASAMINIGFAKNNDIKLDHHWYVSFQKDFSNLHVNGNYNFLKSKQESYRTGLITINKIQDCWSYGLFYRFQKMSSKNLWQDFGLNFKLL